MPSPETTNVVATRTLPKPRLRSDVSLEEAIARRESVREFAPRLLRREEMSQLLWAAQGLTREWGARSAPSAGALYPLELYVATPEGLFHYLPEGHRLDLLSEDDPRGGLALAALGQEAVEKAAAVFVITAVHARSAVKYGARGDRFVTLEAGHVAQNLLLQAVALGLAAVPIGAFENDEVWAVLELPRKRRPLYLVAVGNPGTPRRTRIGGFRA